MSTDLKNLKRLETLLTAFDSGAVQPQELIQAVDAVMAIITQSGELLSKKINETGEAKTGEIKQLESKLDSVSNQLATLINEVRNDSSLDAGDIRQLVATEIKRIEAAIPVLPKKFDASDIQTSLLEHKALLDGLSVLVVGENVRNSLEALPEGDKLAIDAIEGLAEALAKRQAQVQNATAIIAHRLDQIGNVSIVGATNGQALIYQAATDTWVAGSVGGGGGGGGLGDVVGPASAVNNQVAFFDGATGKLIKDSGLTLSGSNTGDNATNTQYSGLVSNANHSGDATGSTVLTIAANAVTNAKAAQMATKTYKGRTTAGTGNSEDVAVATLKTDLVLVKADVGLGSVDNTADTAKPVSTAQQTALNLKADDNAVVKLTGAQTIAGAKTFSTPIATASVATMSATVGGGVPTPPNNTTTFLRGDGTFAAPPGGSGSGITRIVSVTSGSVTAAAVASTDYVFFVAGAHTVSLPAASGNTNQYTIKNNHTAAITVDTVGSENIDGTASISVKPEESVNIISNGTNFFIV